MAGVSAFGACSPFEGGGQGLEIFPRVPFEGCVEKESCGVVDFGKGCPSRAFDTAKARLLAHEDDPPGPRTAGKGWNVPGLDEEAIGIEIPPDGLYHAREELPFVCIKGGALRSCAGGRHDDKEEGFAAVYRLGFGG